MAVLGTMEESTPDYELALSLQRMEMDPDNDSAFDAEKESDTESLTSSITLFQWENNRTYHGWKEGKYPFPNDPQEVERLNLQHQLFKLTLDGRLGMAPCNLPNHHALKVLDIGTGSGAWAIEFGDTHPEAEVMGIDLSPIQPPLVPNNVEFFLDDFEEDWLYARPFTFIHSRMMNFSVSNWREYLCKIFDNLEPGGYVELEEMEFLAKSDDESLAPHSELTRWAWYLFQASVVMGRPLVNIMSLKGLMEEIGFTDIVETTFQWPLNYWPASGREEEWRELSHENALSGLEAFTIAPFTRGLHWDPAEVAVFLAGVRKDITNPNIRAYWPVVSVYGRKPHFYH